MDNGQWTMDNGQWIMDNGQWTMDNGQWIIILNIDAKHCDDTGVPIFIV